MHIRNKIPLYLLVSLALLLGACVPAGSADPLAGSQWRLLEIDREDYSQYNITLAFDDEAGATGSGGCNSYGGAYEVDGSNGKLQFSEITSTLMACADEGVTNAESAYFQALNSVGEYALGNGQLTLLGDHTLLFAGQ